MEGATVISREGGRILINKDKVALLNYLRAREGSFVSGQELAEKLGYSRPVIWKDVQYLKDLQYRIEARSKLGYRLTASPEILHPLEYLPFLKTERLGRTCFYQRVMESTHQMARLLVEQGVPTGTIVCTEYQTKGIGRFGRKWFSPFGKDILCSVLLFPAMEASFTSVVPMAVAVAACNAIEEMTGRRINVMWPNDLTYAQKKLGGILVEAGFTGNEVSWLIVSLGLNVNSQPNDFPQGVREGVTSLAEITGETQRRSPVLAAYLEHLERVMKTVEEGGSQKIVSEWRSHALFIGEPVTIVFLNGEIQEGLAVDVDEQGRLEFQNPAGTRLISAAEVLNIRMSPSKSA